MQHFNDGLFVAIVAIVGMGAILIQWWTMRTIHRKSQAESHTRRQLEQQTASKLLAQSRRQIEQLQQEMAVLRQQIKRTARPVAKPAAPTNTVSESLLGMLDAAEPARRRLPVDGFADTLPSLQFGSASF